MCGCESSVFDGAVRWSRFDDVDRLTPIWLSPPVVSTLLCEFEKLESRVAEAVAVRMAPVVRCARCVFCVANGTTMT